MNNLKEIYQYRDMIGSLVKRELRGKYAKSVLGFLWAFLYPLFQILIYTLVFKYVFNNRTPFYYIYLMSGLLPWTFFSDSFGQGAGSVIYNSEMVKKIYFPREVLVISEVNAKLINMLLSFIVMFFFILFSTVGFSRQLVLLPVLVLIEYLMTLGLSFLSACITVYFRDFEYVVNVVLMAWIWMSPVLYRLDDVGGKFRSLLMLNPFTIIIDSYHLVLFDHAWPKLSYLLTAGLEGIVVLIIGYLIFSKLKGHFVEEL